MLIEIWIFNFVKMKLVVFKGESMVGFVLNKGIFVLSIELFSFNYIWV